MNGNKKIHWAGGLMVPTGRMLPGWSCCGSGEFAEKVAREGNQTRVVEDVTCKKCQALLVKVGMEDVDYYD